MRARHFPRLWSALIGAAVLVCIAADAGAWSAKVAPRLRDAVRGAGGARQVLVLTSSAAPIAGMSTASARIPARAPRAVRVTATPAELQKLAGSSDVIAIVPDEPPTRPPLPGPQIWPELGMLDARSQPLPDTWLATELVGARAAWKLGYTGRGVKVAIIDEGIDFGHPDLQGTQARDTNPDSPYYGWPIVFDPYSMAYYAASGQTVTTAYCDTRPTVTEANPVMEGYTYALPHTSKSGVYHWGLHPSYWLPYLPPVNRYVRVLVADEHIAGVYDTVYMDLDKDRDFTDEKRCVKGDEIAWHDIDGDAIADISGGMVYFIADGIHPIPASDWLYDLPAPAAGSLVCLAGSFDKYESHGTLVASAVAAQGVVGVGEPAFRADGGGIVRGTAPDAKIISIGNVYKDGASVYDAVLFATLGYDGLPKTGDEADIANLSFGYSGTYNDGWDYLARYITYLNAVQAPRTTFVAATGNGGPGYGTVTSPGSSPSVISVGASTLYGSVPVFDDIESAEQILFGDIQPWSNRGPSALGACEPDVVAVGAWATGAVPLFGDGANAWGVWGGTSLACPMACGVLATVYQAYAEAHGQYPTWQMARQLLTSGARDLGYPVLEQGAGQVDAQKSVLRATGRAIAVSPTSWNVGQTAPGFLGAVAQGRSSHANFQLHNPSASTVRVMLSSETYVRTGEITIPIRAANDQETPEFAAPAYLISLLPYIPAGTDLLRARASIPLDQITASAPASADKKLDSGWLLAVFDWTDRNSNGLIWRDDVRPNGVVNFGELDEKELNRFSYDSPAGNCLEVSVSNPLGRCHDGLFAGLQHHRQAETIPVTNISVALEFYERVPWKMLDLRPRVLTLPPYGRAAFRAVFSASSQHKPGVYSGAIRVAANRSDVLLIPVVASVTNSPDTAFGLEVWGSDGAAAPYDNGVIRGAVDWGWRPETGDWRSYFYTAPASLAGRGKLLANVNWQRYPTDIDVLLFGPDPTDYFSNLLPGVFGPYALTPIGGSRQTNLSGAVWPFFTNTGTVSEWVSGSLAHGTHLALLHCVLNGGIAANEPISVSLGPVVVEPSQLDVTGSAPSTGLLTLTPYLYFWQGAEARGFGFSRPIVLDNQPISMDPKGHPDASRWWRDITLSDAGLLEVAVTSPHNIDIDLYVLHDANGDRYFDWYSEIVDLSGSTGADEKVSIRLPPDGSYRIVVNGYHVMQSPSTFSIRISAIQGRGLDVIAPTGPILPGQHAPFALKFRPGSAGEEGIIFLGPRGAPAAVDVRVQTQ